MRVIRRLTCLALVAVVAGLGGCTTLDAPDQNASTLDLLTTAPTRSAVATATQGLVRAMRGDATGVVVTFGLLGREGYILDPGNPQNTPAYFLVLADIGLWGGPYAAIKLADVVLTAVPKVPGVTAAEQEAIRGFVKTIYAIELLRVINSMDQSGAALDAAATPTDTPPPIVGPAQVYAKILQIGRAHV